MAFEILPSYKKALIIGGKLRARQYVVTHLGL